MLIFYGHFQLFVEKYLIFNVSCHSLPIHVLWLIMLTWAEPARLWPHHSALQGNPKLIHKWKQIKRGYKSKRTDKLPCFSLGSVHAFPLLFLRCFWTWRFWTSVLIWTRAFVLSWRWGKFHVKIASQLGESQRPCLDLVIVSLTPGAPKLKVSGNLPCTIWLVLESGMWSRLEGVMDGLTHQRT